MGERRFGKNHNNSSYDNSGNNVKHSSLLMISILLVYFLPSSIRALYKLIPHFKTIKLSMEDFPSKAAGFPFIFHRVLFTKLSFMSVILAVEYNGSIIINNIKDV